MSKRSVILQVNRFKYFCFSNFRVVSCITLFLALVVISSESFSATVKLEWKQNSETDISGYRVHYGNGSRIYNTTIDVGPNINYSLSLDQVGEYYIALTAYNSSGLESDYSTELIANVTNGILSSTLIKLDWKQNPEADILGYRVHYGTQSRIYDNMEDVGPNVTHLLSLDQVGKYYIALTAYNSSGLESDYSTELIARVVNE